MINLLPLHVHTLFFVVPQEKDLTMEEEKAAAGGADDAAFQTLEKDFQEVSSDLQQQVISMLCFWSGTC